MKARRVSALLLMTGLLVPRPLRAEDAGPAAALSPGQRIRFETGTDSRRTATLVETDGDVLVVRIAGGDQVARVPIADMRRLEVSAGRHSHVRNGALIGAIPGVVFGGLAGAFAACYDDPDCSALPVAAVGALIVGAATAGLGAAVGAAIKTERWQPVGTPRARLQIGPTTDGGLAVGLKVSF